MWSGIAPPWRGPRSISAAERWTCWSCCCSTQAAPSRANSCSSVCGVLTSTGWIALSTPRWCACGASSATWADASRPCGASAIDSGLSSARLRHKFDTTPDQAHEVMKLVDTIIDAKGVWKRYDAGKHKIEALRGLDLVVRRGEVVAIMGPSGGGKTPLPTCPTALDLTHQRPPTSPPRHPQPPLS